ncbi:Ribosomal protein S18 acetylase RimI [Bryocella elongata]|uniref:Ribosomal protein S18 acetylase RimI n=1 Tax=Bryocella elongata TaxID=863522 RepID=A0A1H5VSF5_9BACT|nr:GNAT family N-acetyltransferase [Bryocella elongata]SEF90164.1 Ribosomal protein S18 acetylase RimI [Bryocella elongata]
MPDTVCDFLEWDTNFFGVRIARIKDDHLTAAQVSLIEDWASEEAIDCLYFFCNADDNESIVSAERMNCHLVDIRLEFEMKLPSSGAITAPTSGIRSFRPEDVPALMSLASTSHRGSRFYSDGRFPQETCDKLYARWIERSCMGYANQVLVAEFNGAPAGYISCHLHPDGEGSLGLLAVAEQARGQGLGGALMREGTRYLQENGCVHVNFIAQARNITALRIYEGLGFRMRGTKLCYHKWISRGTNQAAEQN